ncbi:PAS domain-containing protein [Nocardioides sp. GY 10127]|uniref:PAS domain-containing protein n=1 Tax=Nocardioides sp. GY 10127 TaxID=2569762 RepID=UPI0010A9000A|nr:PAS domain-containing protein [Nocardioides sp. GY 10127]TIC86393.1 hypothetical protein E8D37_00305 [Nocardioides sp. GY 10127]
MNATRTRPAPNGLETTFPPSDLFFSRTDDRGHILSGNTVFAQVSKYELADLVGAPHSIVRHPSMPRGLFRLLWTEISEGRQIVAYTDNLASDGSHYWTLASIRPVPGGEYLSVRAKPCDTATMEVVSGLYAQVLEHEQELAAGGMAARDVADAGYVRLLELLASAGYPSYREFQRELLPREVALRSEATASGGQHPSARRGRVHGELDDSHAALVQALDTLVGGLGPFTSESARLGDQAAYLRTLARTIRRFSLNSQILGYQVGDSGAGLSAVARLINDEAGRFAGLVTPVADTIASIREHLAELTFAVASAKMQLDVIDVFVTDLGASHVAPDGSTQGADPVRMADLRGLVDNLALDIEAAAGALHELQELSSGLDRPLGKVELVLSQISLLAFNGRVEAVRLEDPASALQLFNEVRALAKAAGSQLSGGTTLAGLVREAAREEMVVQDSLLHVLTVLESFGRAA